MRWGNEDETRVEAKLLVWQKMSSVTHLYSQRAKKEPLQSPYPDPRSSLAAQPVNNHTGCTHQALVLTCPRAQLAPTQTKQSLGLSKPSGAPRPSFPYTEHRPACSKGHPTSLPGLSLTSTSLCHPLLYRCSERCHPCAGANHDHGGVRVSWELHSSFLHPKRHPDITCRTIRPTSITLPCRG